MTVDSSRDIFVFVLCILCGFLSGLAFDFFRSIRKIFTPSKGMVAIQDIIFCALVFAMFSYVTGRFNDGIVRWYEIAGVFLGIMMYVFTISHTIIKAFSYAFTCLKRVCEKSRHFFRRLSHFAEVKFKAFHKKLGNKITLKIGIIQKNAKKCRKKLQFGEKINKKIFTSQKK